MRHLGVAALTLLLPFAALFYTWWLQGKLNRYARQQLMGGERPAIVS